MSHFYGTLQGASGVSATRTGSKKSGMITYCASRKGAVKCRAYIHQSTGDDWIIVEKVPWQGTGEYKTLYEGPIGEEKP